MPNMADGWRPWPTLAFRVGFGGSSLISLATVAPVALIVLWTGYSQPTMSPEQYVRGIDEIDRAASASGARMAKTLGEVRSAASEEAATRLFDSFLKQGTATYVRMSTALRKLTPPPEFGDEHRRLEIVADKLSAAFRQVHGALPSIGLQPLTTPSKLGRLHLSLNSSRPVRHWTKLLAMTVCQCLYRAANPCSWGASPC
jgi:hypothetical protein